MSHLDSSVPSDGEDVPESVTLSPREAFLAMSDFLWRYAETAGDDLLTLLGDTALLSDGQPTDPAAWVDWMKSVDRIRRGQQPRTDDF